jgi:hypothetical protein
MNPVTAGVPAAKTCARGCVGCRPYFDFAAKRIRRSRPRSPAVDKAFAWVSRSHSHTVMTCHPSSSSCLETRLSRFTFRVNFSTQNSVFDFGVVATLHPGCRCQKQPWTNMTQRYLGNTKSGLPGKPVFCTRNRKPRPWRALRRAISGFVFCDRIRDIRSERCAGVSVSTMASFFRDQGPRLQFEEWQAPDDLSRHVEGLI